MELSRGDWLAPAVLDRVTVAVEYVRDNGPEVIDITVTGHSRKRVAPLWTWSVREDDDRNVASVIGGVLGSVTYYRPTTPVKFLRACVGGETDGPEGDPEMFPDV